jgi:hypothetical protein
MHEKQHKASLNEINDPKVPFDEDAIISFLDENNKPCY